jgi:YHS domain-containing protein
MIVDPGRTDLVATHQGNSYCFCAEACRKAFEVSPQKYLAPKSAKVMGPKGWWGRYLERMAKSNRELFGDSRPQCH